MRLRSICLAALAAVVTGCRSASIEGGARARGSAEPVETVQAVAPSAAPSVSSASSVPEPDWSTVSVSDRLTRGPLEQIVATGSGQIRGRVAGTSVVLRLSTNERPLAHRAPVAYYRVAKLVAPGLVPATALRRIPLADLARAAKDERTRSFLRRRARVLADGMVRAAVTRAPPVDAEVVDVVTLAPGSVVWSWEKLLMSRDAIPKEQESILSAYEALLIADYLLGNLRRRRASRTAGSLVAVEDNDVFSGREHEGAIGDPINRLARYTVYPRSVFRRLRQLERSTVAKAMVGERPGWSLVTPKQVDEILRRRASVLRLVGRRIELRGEDRALSLP